MHNSSVTIWGCRVQFDQVAIPTGENHESVTIAKVSLMVHPLRSSMLSDVRPVAHALVILQLSNGWWYRTDVYQCGGKLETDLFAVDQASVRRKLDEPGAAGLFVRSFDAIPGKTIRSLLDNVISTRWQPHVAVYSVYAHNCQHYANDVILELCGEVGGI